MRTVERIALQSILHLKLYANADGQHMRTRKLHSCSVSALFFPIKTLLNQSWAVSYPLAHKCSPMWTSVAVSAILLSLSVSLVLFSTVKQWPGTVLPPCGKTWLLQNNFSAHVRPERTKYARLQKSGGARTVLMTQFAVPRVRVKSEVYFGP